MKLRQSALLGLMTIAALASGAACSSDTTSETPEASIFAEALAEAKAEGSGPEQIAALEAAQAAGGLSIEAAREAARRTITCLTEAGIKAEPADLPMAGGVSAPGYHVALQGSSIDEATNASIKSCEERESWWINQVFQMQPVSVQRNEDFANQQVDVLRACLEDKGITTDPHATGVDLANQAAELRNGSDGKDDCLSAAGINAW